MKLYDISKRILANRACSLRLSNIFIAKHQLFVYYIVPILFLVELLLMKYSKVVPGATIYKITRFYLNSNYCERDIAKYCLRLFCCYITRFTLFTETYHNIDHWGIKLYHHTNFHI